MKRRRIKGNFIEIIKVNIELRKVFKNKIMF